MLFDGIPMLVLVWLQVDWGILIWSYGISWVGAKRDSEERLLNLCSPLSKEGLKSDSNEHENNDITIVQER